MVEIWGLDISPTLTLTYFGHICLAWTIFHQGRLSLLRPVEDSSRSWNCLSPVETRIRQQRGRCHPNIQMDFTQLQIFPSLSIFQCLLVLCPTVGNLRPSGFSFRCLDSRLCQNRDKWFCRGWLLLDQCTRLSTPRRSLRGHSLCRAVRVPGIRFSYDNFLSSHIAVWFVAYETYCLVV